MPSPTPQFVAPALGRTLVRLAGTASQRRAALEAAAELALGSGPGAVADTLPVALWRSPLEWLVLGEPGRSPALAERLTHALGAATGLVVDYTDAMAAIELRGDSAVVALASGCAVDVQSWPAHGAYCVPTAFARVPALIHRLAPGHFWLHVDRSQAQYVRQWLAAGATHEA